MNYKLSRKNEQGKWWTYGDFKLNKFNNYSASFKVSSLKELIALAEKENSQWVNLSAFEEKDDEDKTPKSVVTATSHHDDIADDIPFAWIAALIMPLFT